MIFSSLQFVIFFGCVLVLLLLFRTNRLRKLLLLAASYYFYSCWDWRFLGLILISTTVDYLVGGRLAVTAQPRVRKSLLMVSLCVNLGVLGFFKYFNFFIDSFSSLLASLGLHVGTLDIILPVGISFYTFQTLSYTLDIYRGEIEPHDSYTDFALFVAFFPQLVAGPIVRAAHFLPQLKEYKPLTHVNFYAGFQRFTYGLFKKVFVADRLAYYSDPVFQNAGLFDGPSTWMGAIAYTLQIYYDFSGYSDMAIGTARMLGYDLGENFNFPYLSKSPREFWRRWHISLSTWVRDYIYIPLGGSWRGIRRTYFNVIVTMVLCGLWHGAAWTFVVWGGLHGVALAANRLWMGRDRGETGRLRSALGWAATMLFVVLGWVLFRADGFDSALLMVKQMAFASDGVSWLNPFVPLVLAGTIGVHWLKATGRWGELFLPDAPRWYSPALLFSLIGCALVFYPSTFKPFIYFQF